MLMKKKRKRLYFHSLYFRKATEILIFSSFCYIQEKKTQKNITLAKCYNKYLFYYVKILLIFPFYIKLNFYIIYTI